MATSNLFTETTRELSGLPEAPEDFTPAPDADEEFEANRLARDTLDHLGAIGELSPVTIADERVAFDNSSDTPGLFERVSNLFTMDRERGNTGGSVLNKNRDGLDKQTFDLIKSEEGFVQYQYNDFRGANVPWKRGDDGNPTVGYGFNLNQPNAREMLKDVGLDWDKVMNGSQIVNETQARRLLEKASATARRWVNNHFKGVPLTDNQRAALTSLTYNSKWTKGGPTLIGPRLTKAVREERWEDAAKEIAWFSEKMPPEAQHLVPGIHARRVKEAKVFLGPEMAEAFGEKFGWKNPDTLPRPAKQKPEGF